MNKAAVNYGNALYELARDRNLSGKILEEFGEVAKILDENPDYVRVLSLTSLSKTERCGLLDRAFSGKIEQYLLNYLKVMLENGHIQAAAESYGQYKKRYYEDAGIEEAYVTSAVELTAEQRKRLQDKLASLTGKDVILHTSVDQKLIGGIRLQLGGQQYDGTVRDRLDRLKNLLSETVI